MQKTQSAMEYLMTYGWAILIIAVILIGLNYLGVFNSETFAPKEATGACYVLRTAAQVSLAGECNGYIPRYVAYFNGQNAYVNLGNNAVMSPEAGANGQMTLCMWYMIVSTSGYHGPLLKGESSPSSGNAWEYTLDQSGSAPGFVVWNSGGQDIADNTPSGSVNAGNWKFACFTYNYPQSTSYYYLNGTQYAATWNAARGSASQGTGNLVIGSGEGGYSNIYASNIQLYNASLSASTIEAMYVEGIGGAPIELQNLVGWWPLNGDTNDYSGNGNNGVNNNVAFSANWYTSYTPS